MELFRIIDVHLSDQGSADLSLLFSSTSSFQLQQEEDEEEEEEEEEEAFVGGHESLVLQMSELGLPTCFSSTPSRMGSRRPRHRRRRRKSLSSHQVTTSLDDEFSRAVVNESLVQSPLQMSPIDSVQVSTEAVLDDDGARISNNEANHCSLIELNSVLIGDITSSCKICNDKASPLSCGVMDATSSCAMLALDATVQTDESKVTIIEGLGTMLNNREPLVSETARLSDDGGLIGRAEVMVLSGGNVASDEQALVSAGRETATKDGSYVEALLRVSNNVEATLRDKADASEVLNGIAAAEDEETIPLNGSNHGAVDAGAMADSVCRKGTDARVNNVLVEVAGPSMQEILVEDSQFPSPDWSAYWDDYYGRYYFYNRETLESTWEPPKGYESYAYIPAVEDSNKALQDSALNDVSNNETLVTKECKGEVLSDDGRKSDGLLPGVLSVEYVSSLSGVKEASSSESHLGCIQSNFADGLDGEAIQTQVENEGDQENVVLEPSVCREITTMAPESSAVHVEVATCKVSVPMRRAKKAASLLVRLENQRTHIAAAMGDHSPAIFKYWAQRFRLFSKYDLGVKLDEEGWFSVTPEAIAKHQAARCRSGVIVDAFTGVGGNAIQFALAGHYVVAIDNDPKKIEYARHNAMVYGVAARIDFVLGDFFAVSSSMQADVVFLSPPWGGPDYLDCKVYDILTMLQPKDGVSLFKVARAVAPNIIFFLPRNVDMNQLAELSKTTLSPCCCEVERNFLNGKLKAVTAYYGQFVSTEETCS